MGGSIPILISINYENVSTPRTCDGVWLWLPFSSPATRTQRRTILTKAFERQISLICVIIISHQLMISKHGCKLAFCAPLHRPPPSAPYPTVGLMIANLYSTSCYLVSYATCETDTLIDGRTDEGPRLVHGCAVAPCTPPCIALLSLRKATHEKKRATVVPETTQISAQYWNNINFNN